MLGAAGSVAYYPAEAAGWDGIIPHYPLTKWIAWTPGGELPPPNQLQGIAYATKYAIQVDGHSVVFDAYALKDEKGNDTNYIKLRDMAYMLNGTASQFNVGWRDGAITVQTLSAYTSPNGSEMQTAFQGNQLFEENQSLVLVNGQKATLGAISLIDDSGKGHTYFKLRDMGQRFGFDVRWDGQVGAVCVTTGVTYTG